MFVIVYHLSPQPAAGDVIYGKPFKYQQVDLYFLFTTSFSTCQSISNVPTNLYIRF